jgi:hypothetical protein
MAEMVVAAVAVAVAVVAEAAGTKRLRFGAA